MNQVIYETKGRAREFSELAINLFDFCTHNCVYCYSPLVLHKNRGAFATGLYPRVTENDAIQSAKQWKDKGETRRVLISFTCDPYQPIEQKTQITRKTIMALHKAGLNVTILTKAGMSATRDFDLLTPYDAFATTLTCLSYQDSSEWEPNAASPAERIKSLLEAHQRDIETWVSLEPVIYPWDSEMFVRMLHNKVSHFKISKLNYTKILPPELYGKVKDIDWHKFGWSIKELCDSLGAKYYIKKDLLKEMGVSPEDFQQTWVCH